MAKYLMFLQTLISIQTMQRAPISQYHHHHLLLLLLLLLCVGVCGESKQYHLNVYGLGAL